MRPSEKSGRSASFERTKKNGGKKNHRKKKSTHQQKEQITSRKFESAKFLWETHFFFHVKKWLDSSQIPSFLTSI